MSVNVRVEIPSHAHTLRISLSVEATVRDLKQAIFEQCQGKPAVDGQRLITKGRVLQDHEIIDAIWTEQDIKIVFLAVNPTSWTSIPPTQSTRPSLSSVSRSNSSHNLNRTTPAFQVPALTTSQRPQPLSYIQYLHTNALLALQRAPLVNVPSWDISATRDWSKLIVESYGYEWPKVLDEDFPGTLSTVYPPRGGVFYRSQYINGYPYMSLSPKSTEPTPLQTRALEILTYTFPLLSSTFQPVYCPTWISASQMFYPPSNSLLPTSVTGVQPIANAQNNAHQNPRIPPAIRPQLLNFPFRAFAVPFIMLSLRTLFLLYIFSPARKPIFALAITVWLVWELWAAAQGVLAEERAAIQPQAPGAQRNRIGNAANGNARPDGQLPAVGNDQVNAGNRNRWTPQQSINRLAAYNLREEETAFNAPEATIAAQPPSLLSRLKHAAVLFVLTIHPEVWNRRRRSLREREARIKREFAERRRQRPEGDQTMEPVNEDDQTEQQQSRIQAQPEAQVRRREPWLDDYIERVERAEWVDG